MRFSAIFQRLVVKAWAVSASAQSHRALASWRLKNSGFSGGRGALVSGVCDVSDASEVAASAVALLVVSGGAWVSAEASFWGEASCPESWGTLESGESSV